MQKPVSCIAYSNTDSDVASLNTNKCRGLAMQQGIHYKFSGRLQHCLPQVTGKRFLPTALAKDRPRYKLQSILEFESLGAFPAVKFPFVSVYWRWFERKDAQTGIGVGRSKFKSTKNILVVSEEVQFPTNPKKTDVIQECEKCGLPLKLQRLGAI